MICLKPLCWTFLLGLLLCSCATTSNLNDSTFNSTIISILGDSYELQWNRSNTTAIAQKTNSQNKAVQFLVIDKSGRVRERGSFIPGYIKWIDNNTIEYLSLPEIMRENESVENYIKKIILD